MLPTGAQSMNMIKMLMKMFNLKWIKSPVMNRFKSSFIDDLKAHFWGGELWTIVSAPLMVSRIISDPLTVLAELMGIKRSL